MRTRSALILLMSMTGATSAPAETLTLTNGDTLSGEVVEAGGEKVILHHPVLGRIELPADEVTSIHRPAEGDAPAEAPTEPATIGATPKTTPGAAAGDEAAIEEAKPRGIFGTGLFAGWDSALSLGFSGSQGNSEQQSINLSFKTVYEDERDRIQWDNTYFFNQEDNSRSQNEFKTELTRDWLLPDSPWFYFARGLYQYDEFEAWEQRASGFGGVGYTFLDMPDLEINSRVGAGITYEFGEVNTLTPEALVGASVVRWNITEGQTLTASNMLYPALDDLGEFRNVSSVEWKAKVAGSDNMSLKLGVENEYESRTEDDDEHNDLKYYGAVVFDW